MYKVKYLHYTVWLDEYDVVDLELEKYDLQDALKRLMQAPNKHVLDVTEVE